MHPCAHHLHSQDPANSGHNALLPTCVSQILGDKGSVFWQAQWFSNYIITWVNPTDLEVPRGDMLSCRLEVSKLIFNPLVKKLETIWQQI